MSPLPALAQSSSFPSHDDLDRQTGNSDGVELVRPGSFALSFAAVVACGTLNNFSYCIISGASQDLARQFHAEEETTLLTTAMNVSALAATCISARLLLRFRFYTRVRLALAMQAVAYAGVAWAASPSLPGGFALSAAAACVAGMGQVFGEVTNLAFLRTFPPELVGGWGAGTGVAGILGSGLYILLRGPLKLSSSVVFALAVPLALPYWAAFHHLHREATQGFEGPRLAKALGGAGSLRAALAASASSNDPREQLRPSPGGAAPASAANVRAAIRASGSIMFNLVAVYCLEYTVYPGLDDRETLCAPKQWYTAMWMCYNVGVTLSRLSVAVFRIRRVWLLTCFQLANVVGWTAEVYSGAIRDAFSHEGGLCIMAAWMVLVGLCGGATYGNCMYLFNNQAGIPEDLRELGIGLGFLMSNTGITIATLSFTLLDRTIMDPSVLYPSGCPSGAVRS